MHNCPSYPQTTGYLSTFLFSLAANKVPPQVFVVITDTDRNHTNPQAHINLVNSFLGLQMAQILPIYAEDAAAINPDDFSSDFGYAYTDAAINYLISHNLEYNCKYLLVTNGDNLYRSKFIDDYLQPEMDQETQMIGFNFISHHDRWDHTVTETEKADGRNREVSVQFQPGAIDLGACFFKMDLLESDPINLRFVNQAKSKGNDYFNCDGYLINEYHKRAASAMIIRDVLFFHQ